MFSINGFASHFEFHFDFLYPQPFSSCLKIEAGVGSALIDLWAAEKDDKDERKYRTMKFQRKSLLHTTCDTPICLFMIIKLMHSFSIKHLLIVKGHT